MTKYATTKGLLTFISVSAWLSICASLYLGFEVGGKEGFLIAAAGLLAGLSIVAICQLGGAIIASAENSTEMVKLLRQQNQITRQLQLDRRQSGVEQGRSEPVSATVGKKRVKVYKGYEIYRRGDGTFEVAGETFQGLLAAEAHVSGQPS